MTIYEIFSVVPSGRRTAVSVKQVGYVHRDSQGEVTGSFEKDDEQLKFYASKAISIEWEPIQDALQLAIGIWDPENLPINATLII